MYTLDMFDVTNDQIWLCMSYLVLSNKEKLLQKKQS